MSDSESKSSDSAAKSLKIPRSPQSRENSGDRMADLKKQRGTMKALLTLFDKYFINLKDTELNSTDKAELKLRMQSIESLYQNFNQIQCEIERLSDQNQLEKQLEYREQFEEQYFRALAAAGGRLVDESMANSTCTRNTSSKLASVKLPEIKLPTFNGSYDQWLEFRNSYDTMIHERDDLDAIQKFHYLRSSLSGSALQLIVWRDSPEDPLGVYQLNTVTYGTASAAYLSMRCLRQLASECGDDVIARVINEDFLVDDLITGCDDYQQLHRPVSILNRKGRGGSLVKGYICLFVCFVTRAIHLELVSGLSTKDYILALKRFYSRRAHFLIGRPLTAPASADLTGAAPHRLLRYDRVEQMRQHFWRRWSKEYVSELQIRSKWKTREQDLQTDMMVLIKEDNTPPLRWRLGRIVRTYPGKDGVSRVADIRTARGIIQRTFAKICPLPMQADEDTSGGADSTTSTVTPRHG
ncbi:unnamed protein product [Plutella xylostella]|uniref:(diamondback moth) hypothetical protein n=1 Tax=Plutella xylostella TaxID=51655 RepID=A0A8S4EFT0_PLUXY|nr:unnamed protein product [Plutella xylostella]